MFLASFLTRSLCNLKVSIRRRVSSVRSYLDVVVGVFGLLQELDAVVGGKDGSPLLDMAYCRVSKASKLAAFFTLENSKVKFKLLTLFDMTFVLCAVVSLEGGRCVCLVEWRYVFSTISGLRYDPQMLFF